MLRPVDQMGFAPPPRRRLGRERRVAILAELLATVGLAAGTTVAATVITAGIARADGLAALPGQHTSVVAIAVVFGLLLVGMGGLTAMSLAPSRRRSLRD